MFRHSLNGILSLSLSFYLSLSPNAVPPVRLGLGAYPSEDLNLIEPVRRDRSIKTSNQLFDQYAAGSGSEI